MLQNKVTGLLRKAKSKFFRKLRPLDAKQFWKAVNVFNCKETSIPTLQYQSATASTNRDKANMLNTFFTDCFNHSVEPLSLINQVGFHAQPITCPPEMQR